MIDDRKLNRAGEKAGRFFGMIGRIGGFGLGEYIYRTVPIFYESPDYMHYIVDSACTIGTAMMAGDLVAMVVSAAAQDLTNVLGFHRKIYK